jgi:hypothetical protein
MFVWDELANILKNHEQLFSASLFILSLL